MAYQDRDYYREGEGANPLATSVVVKLIVVNVVVFLANLFFGQAGEVKNAVVGALSLQPDAILHPWQWYQFLTYGFTHDAQHLMHIGFNMLGLYFFGRQLESRFGWKEFLRFYLLAIVLGGVVWSGRNVLLTGPMEVNVGGTMRATWGPLIGASGGVTATVILFCLLYPKATLMMFFVVPTPAWLAGLIIVALDMFAGHGDRIAHDVHLTGAAFALGYWYFGWNFGKLPGAAELARMTRKVGKTLTPKPDLRVHDPEAHYENLDEEADRLLEKVSRDGAGSLSAREKRLLEAYSRRMRQKHR